MKKTFIRHVGELKMGEHLLLLYRNTDKIQEELLEFIRIRLSKNEKILFFLGEETYEDQMESVFRSEPVYRHAIESGQFELHRGVDIYFPDQKFEPDRVIGLLSQEADLAVQQGYAGLAVTGDISGALEFPNGAETILEYEWKLNKHIFGSKPVLAICRYNIDRFEASMIKAVIELHEAIIYEGRIHQNPYYLHYEAFEKNQRDQFEVDTWLENINGFTGEINRFMTYSQQVEKLNDKLFQSMQDAVLVFTKDEKQCYRLIQSNPNGQKLYGEAESFMGASLDSLFLPQEEARAFCVDVFVDVNRSCRVFLAANQEKIVVAVEEYAIELNGKSYLYVILNDLRERIRIEKDRKDKRKELLEKSLRIVEQNRDIALQNQRLESLTKNIERLMKLINGLNTDSTIHDYFIGIAREMFEMIPSIDVVQVNILDGMRMESIEILSNDIVTIRERNLSQDEDDCECSQADKFLNYHAYGSKRQIGDTINQIKSSVYKCMVANGETCGGILVGSYGKNENLQTTEVEKLLDAIGILGVSYIQNVRYMDELESTMNAIIRIIIQIMEMHDPYTKGHSDHVAIIARYLSEKMGLSTFSAERIFIAGMLHDIGKILLPISILNKPGRLSESEYERVREHARWGYSILSANRSFQDIGNFVLHHHERWDGSGYPSGLKENRIPIEAQILAVADAWDAMISTRSYRPAIEFDQAVDQVEVCMGTQFSPKVAEAFLRHIDEIKTISREYLRGNKRR